MIRPVRLLRRTAMNSNRWGYRVWQAIKRIHVTLCPWRIERGPAHKMLEPTAWELFNRMSPGDQAHALCVLEQLRADGPASTHLAQAALLHDVGKIGAGLNLAYRTAIVLLEATGKLGTWADAKPSSWRYPFYLHLHHAEQGAELCKQAGCDPNVIALVRWHEEHRDVALEKPLAHELRALQEADDHC